jgi:hypothetical protein
LNKIVYGVPTMSITTRTSYLDSLMMNNNNGLMVIYDTLSRNWNHDANCFRNLKCWIRVFLEKENCLMKNVDFIALILSNLFFSIERIQTTAKITLVLFILSIYSTSVHAVSFNDNTLRYGTVGTRAGDEHFIFGDCTCCIFSFYLHSVSHSSCVTINNTKSIDRIDSLIDTL